MRLAAHPAQVDTRAAGLRLFEIALVFERLNHPASRTVVTNHDWMRAAVTPCVAECIRDCV
jgi:hypothetical protein